MNNFQMECFGLKKKYIKLEVAVAMKWCLINILEIILVTVGVAFIIFGYEISFKKKYNLINGFEEDYKNGRKTKSCAKKVRLIEFILGIVLVLIGICVFILK